MDSVGKWTVIVPAAAVLTAGLFLGMRGLISGDWEPQEKSSAQKFEINPVIEDIKILPGRKAALKYEQVDIPPAPPVIGSDSAELPSEPPATLEAMIPAFPAPVLNRGPFKLIAIDTSAQPLVRIPPIAPQRFLEGNHSGHCGVKFDVSAEGSPFNVVTTFCTASVLQRPTIKSVQKWRFNPKILNGRAVAMQGLENKVTFQLLDERGSLLPEP